MTVRSKCINVLSSLTNFAYIRYLSSISAAFAANSFNCPPDESTGYFADPDECDKYWDCDRGLAQAKFCADGLAFSARARRSSNPCVYYWQADCQGRTLREYC